jgi:hypothetical protein
MICHQRALSLPQNSNLNINTQQMMQQQSKIINNSTSTSNSSSNHKAFAIQPVHHRTRSLPLTEETAIDFTSQSPPNFIATSILSSPSTSTATMVLDGMKYQQQMSNNSMESIIEDYQNMDAANNNSNSNNSSSSNSHNNHGSYRSSSILKQLSKIANAKANASGNSTSNASSPSQMRKKRQHHNVMTASLRSTYQNLP